MICPCCSVSDISAETNTCDLCGYSLPSRLAVRRSESMRAVSGAVAKRSVAIVPGEATTGVSATIRVTVCDKDGTPLRTGGDSVVVTILGANRANPKVTDVGNGTYGAAYTPTAPGTDRVSVTVNGTPLAGSPFTIEVSAGAADAFQSSATVGEGQAGKATTIALTARDASGNEIGTGGSTVQVAISGANPTEQVPVRDNGDGNYTATYTPTVSGVDEIDVSIDGLPLSGSPYTSVIRPGPIDPGRTEVTVPRKGTPGIGVPITIAARDAYGNALSAGGHAVAVKVHGANRASPPVTDVGNGTYTVTYTPSDVGTDKITVSVGRRFVGGSPYTVTIVPGGADAGRSAVTIPPGVAGAVTTVTLEARDRYGNTLDRGGDTVEVLVLGPNEATLPVTDHDDGRYTAQYTPTASGTDKIRILLNGNDVHGNPFASVVEAGVCDPSRTRFELEKKPRAGRDAAVTVIVCDPYGNPVGRGGATVEAEIEGGNAGPADVSDEGDGRYLASYAPTVAGTDRIRVTVDGQPAEGPWEFAVGAGPASAARTMATVPGGSPNRPTTVTIRAHDEHGNPCDHGGAAIGVRVAGTNEGAAVGIVDRGDGTYEASYVPTEVGTDFVAINLDGNPILDSPQSSVVEVGRADPAQTITTMPSVSRAGTLTNVFVTTCDAYGEQTRTGGEAIAVRIEGANAGAEVTLKDNDDGTYLAQYRPLTSGVDTITVLLNEDPVADSPFEHWVEPGRIDPLRTTATAPPAARVGLPFTVEITARDGFDNQMTGGGASLTASVTGANDGARVSVVDRGDGVYSATYTPSKPGTDRFFITIDGKSIGGDPIRPRVGAGRASAASTVDVPPGRAGKPTEIRIVARDESRNPVGQGGDTVSAEVSVGNHETAEVIDNRDGTYTATYIPAIAGVDYVSVRINGIAVAGNPFKSEVVAGASDAERSTAEVPESVTAGDSVTFTIRAKDAFGNDVKRGGQWLKVAIAGGNDDSTLRMTDHGNGTHTGRYTPTVAGSDQLTIEVNGEVLGGKPFPIEVRPGRANHQQASVRFPTGRAGDLTRATITTRDTYRNPVSAGDAVRVTLSGPNEGQPVEVANNGDGTYAVTYRPMVAGVDVLAVEVNGITIRESPVQGTVRAADPAPDRCLVHVGDGSGEGPVIVRLTVRDRFGNDLQGGGQQVQLEVSGANAGAPFKVRDHGDGTYDIRYVPEHGGIDELTVLVDGDATEGSPFSLPVHGRGEGAASQLAELPAAPPVPARRPSVPAAPQRAPSFHDIARIVESDDAPPLKLPEGSDRHGDLPVLFPEGEPRRIPWLWILLAVVLGAGGIGLVTFLNRPEPVEWVSGVDDGPEPVQDGAAPSGVLTVNGASGGQLFVDGSLIGEIPVAGLRLPPGEHLVAVERPGYEPFVRTITVAAGDTVVVDSVEAEMPPAEQPPN